MAELVTYSAPAFWPRCPHYYVEVNGQEVPVHPVRVSAMVVNELFFGDQREIEQTEIAGMVHFDFTEKVELKVVCELQVFSAKVLPASKKIAVERMDCNGGDELHFTITEPGQYALEVNGTHMALHIFADPMETERPDPNAPNVHYVHADQKPSHAQLTRSTRSQNMPEGKDTLYFGPGMHYVGALELKSGQSVYIHGGAVVCAAISAIKEKNIKVYGRGILYGGLFERNLEPSKLGNLIVFKECENIHVEGVTLLDSPTYNLATAVCRNLVIRNVKVISWRKNSDGIDLHNTQHALIENCFLRCFDDCFTLKGQNFYGGYPCSDHPLQDIRVEHCTAWCDWGRAMEIGAETSGPFMSDVLFHDVEVMHFTFIACDVQACGTAPVSNIVFDDIRVGEALDPQVEPRLGEIFIRPMCWMPGEPLANVRDITFRNIDYRGRVIAPFRFVGYTAEHDISGVKIENVTLNGKRMEGPDEIMAPVVVNEFATNITIDGKPIDRSKAVYESEEDTCTYYQIGNGAFIRA